MSNNTDNKILTLPDAATAQHDAELFINTKKAIDWVNAVASGQQEGSQEDVVSALAVAQDNITALETGRFIAHAAIAGLKESVELLTQQRDEVIVEKEELEATIEARIEEAQQDGWEAAMEDAANDDYYWRHDELDLDEAWQQIKDEMENYVEHLGMKLKLLGQNEAAKELHAKVQAAVRAYDDADSTIIKYNTYCDEHMDEIAAERRKLAEAAAEKAATEASFADDDSDEDE